MTAPSDAFVAKLNADGAALAYSTYLGGNQMDEANSIAVDAAGQAHVCGKTSSHNFSVARAYQAACTPDFFLYDAELNLVYRGQLDDSRPGNGKLVTGLDLRAAMEALVAGQAPNASQKPSIGCNIKWKSGAEPEYFNPAGVS